MGTLRSTSRFLERGVAGLVVVLRSGCFDELGNDPNVPDEATLTVVEAGVDAPVCPKKLPGCTTIPSYATDIAPLIAAKCQPCHEPGGVSSNRDLTTYDNVENLESTVLGQVYACAMPPADAGPDATLTPSERNDFLQWLVCGSPNN
jgi:hypothetical protein